VCTMTRFLIAAYFSCIHCILNASWPPEGQPVRIEVTRDANISSVGNEREGNSGRSSTLKTKSQQEFVILDFDPTAVSGRIIKGAELHLMSFEKDPQRRLTVSTLANEWTEGVGNGYSIEPNGVSCNWAKQKPTPWTYNGSDILSAMCGLGNTMWRFADCSPRDTDGWQRIAIEPSIVSARVAGISRGFVVYDDVGSEYRKDGDRLIFRRLINRYFKSREANKEERPFFTIYLGDEDKTAPNGIEHITSEAGDLPSGEAIIKWTVPEDKGAGVIGFSARFTRDSSRDWEKASPIPQYLIPMSSSPGREVVMRLRDLLLKPAEVIMLGLQPVDGAGNLGPVTWKQIRVSQGPPPINLRSTTAALFTDMGRTPRVGDVDISIVDTLDKIHPATGEMIPKRKDSYLRANHLWSASNKTIRLYAAKNEFVDFQIVLAGKTENLSMEMKFNEEGISAPKPQILRFRHVNTNVGPLPDPLLPLDGIITIPARDEKIEDQKFTSLIAEIYLPHEAKAGLQKGVLIVKNGDKSLTLTIELNVWNFTLPDYLSFIPEMNCYNIGSAEMNYYRLAHVHRTCLNKVPYSQSGKLKGNIPEKNGIYDTWEAFDRSYGPLLDGSAFNDLPRKNVPVDSFYLPLNESWPVKLQDFHNGSYWADEAIAPEYRKQFVNACKQFGEHFSEKHWNDTFFEFFLNNKASNDKEGDQGSTPWLFDEPQNTQDFWALRWFGDAFHEGVAPYCPKTKMVFRCDVSRPQYQRDILDNVLDVAVVSRVFRQYHRIVMDRKASNDEVVLNYGNSNKIEDSNVHPAIWCIDAWCLGMDGVVPWKTIGNKDCWVKAQTEAIFYPPEKKYDKNPFPSVRLKAYRRGQQDVEYLVLLSQALHQPRWAVGNYVRDLLQLSTQKDSNAQDFNYSKIDPVFLWQLRTHLGTALDQLKPKAQKKLVDLRTSPRVPTNYEKYVSIAPERQKVESVLKKENLEVPFSQTKEPPSKNSDE
jgi:hypothetical protein